MAISKRLDLDDDSPWEEPQLPLRVNESSGSMEKPSKPRPVRASAYGSCPGCTASKVALERHGKHLAWRVHILRTWSGAAIQCRAGGSRLCDAPDQEGQTFCPCQVTPGWLRPATNQEGSS